MVSIEAKSNYWIPLRANPLTSFFIDFLDEKEGLLPPQLNISDNNSVACNLLLYVRNNNETEATALYNRLTSRQIMYDSEWIHNDYLIFSLICTVNKFSLDGKWVSTIINHRPNNDSIERTLNKSFDNLLTKNYNSKEDYHQISLVCQTIIKQQQFDSERMHSMFRVLWQKSFPYFESEFLNIISLCAIRIMFESKGLLNPEETFVIKSFAAKFLKRVNAVSKTVTYSIFILVIISLVIAASFYAETTWVKALLASLSALGLGASFFADIRDWLTIRVENLMKRLWGYRQ